MSAFSRFSGCVFAVIACLFLASCLRVADTNGARASLTTDPAMVGAWHTLKWEGKERTIAPGQPADIMVTEIQNEGLAGYRYHSVAPDKEEDIDLWPMDFGGVRFILSDFPEGDCGGCQLLRYEIRNDGTAYVYGLKFDQAKEYLNQNHPQSQKIVVVSTSEWMKEIVVKALDDESKAILKAMAQDPAIWETLGIYKKADAKQQ